MDYWLSRLLNSTWIIPTSILALGGFFIGTLEDAETEIEKIESKIQSSRADLLHDSRPAHVDMALRIEAHLQSDRGQAPQLTLYKENLYPNGNPPYKNLLVEARPKVKAQKRREILDSTLREEIEVAKLLHKQKKKLPRSLNDPVKRRKAIKMLADTYKIFNRDINVASQVVQDAIDNNTRTEAEINEALEAIEQMKRGRHMLIEKIQIIDEADEEDHNDDDFQLPDEED